MAMSIRVAGHPVHPMLVHFPIALWTGAVVADLGGWVAGHTVWWMISFGCQALGVLAALVAMLFGLLDYASIPRQHPAQDTAVFHMLAMGTAWVMFVVSIALRGLPPGQPPSIWATAAAVVGFATMAVGGWLGGQLVYHFGIGVREGAQQQ